VGNTDLLSSTRMTRNGRPARHGGVAPADASLHAFITELSGNAVLAERISQVDRHVRWYYTPIARPCGKDARNEHSRLIRAIADGDAGRASEIMRRHTERTAAFYHKQRSAATEAEHPSGSARRA
jgi:DNA-binding FadR family transcriptional regulator